MTTPLETIRCREYTGENRCWPCTITNAVLLALLAGGLVVVGRRTAAAAVAVVGLVSIALRGYFVPYTPRFAPRVVAALPVGFDGHDDPGSLSSAGATADGGPDADAPSGEDVVAALLEAGVVVPDGEELRLDPAFRDDWQREMEDLRGADLEELASLADDATDPAVEARADRNWGRSVIVLDRADSGLVTLRRHVAIAELAAARALESSVEEPAVRRAAGRPLRSLLERCPRCDAELTVTQSACCGEATPIGSVPSEKLICPDCNERLFTFD